MLTFFLIVAVVLVILLIIGGLLSQNSENQPQNQPQIRMPVNEPDSMGMGGLERAMEDMADAKEEEELEEATQSNKKKGETLERDGYRFHFISRSPNNRYLIAAMAFVKGDPHKNAEGVCLRLDNLSDEAVYFKGLKRAIYGTVNDDGYVVMVDRREQTSSYNQILSYNKMGARMWSKMMRAPIKSMEISPDARHCYVTTHYSDYEPHSRMTFLLDFKTGQELWKTYGVDDTTFLNGQFVAQIDSPDGGERLSFAFNKAGKLPKEFYDLQDKYSSVSEEDQYKHFVLLPKVQQMLEAKPPQFGPAKKLLAKLEIGETELPRTWRAKLLRYLGEIANHEGEKLKALKLWEEALQLDQHVGIQEEYELLKKKLDNVYGKGG